MLPVCHGVTLLVYLQGYYMKSIFTICTPNVSDLVQGEDPQLRSLMYHACVQENRVICCKNIQTRSSVAA